eukprot:TCALIF_08659-PA protein Name:"Similar to GTF2H2 General transcription factor IIH subunit 2 (Bos taurus)" AED:0.09 eAED:0.17 QI:158/0.5/0.77/1/0.75/0.77/9/133/586
MEEDNKEYRWETGYEKTWEAITEDADGLVEVSVQELIQKARRKRMNEKFGKGVKLGMMRHLFVVLDMSECMNNQDLKPTRLRCCLKLLENFIEEFFYLNPISQLGVITTRNKRAEVYSELTGNPKRHVESLKKLIEVQCAGEPSLQNSLDTAIQTLRHMPGHASRELLIIMGSLTTCDPTEIDVTLQTCKQLNIRCSVISLAAEVTWNLLLPRLRPNPPLSKWAFLAIQVIKHHVLDRNNGQNESDSYSGLGLCMCHLDVGNEPKLSISGFLCPQQQSKYEGLKERLVDAFGLDAEDGASAVLDAGPLAADSPSKRMAELLAMFPKGEKPGALFKEVFLRQLRPHIPPLLKNKEFDSLRSLTKAADKLMQPIRLQIDSVRRPTPKPRSFSCRPVTAQRTSRPEGVNPSSATSTRNLALQVATVAPLSLHLSLGKLHGQSSMNNVTSADRDSFFYITIETSGRHYLVDTGAPQCHAKYCELPVECKSCNLTLVSAPHLARSYHHLFPLPAFIEVSLEDLAAMAVSGNCFACNKLFQSPRDKTVFKCPSCLRLFCSDCDIFIHETLHSCPGCASRHPTAHNTNGTTHR